MVTAHGNVLHLVWSQRSAIDNANIYYAQYLGSWTVPIAAFTSAPDSRMPAHPSAQHLFDRPDGEGGLRNCAKRRR